MGALLWPPLRSLCSATMDPHRCSPLRSLFSAPFLKQTFPRYPPRRPELCRTEGFIASGTSLGSGSEGWASARPCFRQVSVQVHTAGPMCRVFAHSFALPSSQLQIAHSQPDVAYPPQSFRSRSDLSSSCLLYRKSLRSWLAASISTVGSASRSA